MIKTFTNLYGKIAKKIFLCFFLYKSSEGNMKVNLISQSTTFKSKGNLEDYLSKISISNNSEIKDLRQISSSLRKETLSRLHEKREVNEQKELQILRGMESPLDSIKTSIQTYLDRIASSTQKTLVGFTMYVDPGFTPFLLSEFKHGTNYLFKDISGKPFENIMQMPKVQTENFENIDEQAVLADLRKVFLEFRDSDTSLMNNYLKQFSLISNKYFAQNNQDFQNIRDIKHVAVKWMERIPVAGLGVKTKRVKLQQMATKNVYEDFQEYNNVVIEKGINPVVFSYIDKLNSIKNYTELIAPYLSNAGNEFIRNLNVQLEKVAESPLKSYQQILSLIAINSETIAHRCNKIINDGDVSVALKTIRSLLTLGVC